MDSTPDNQEIIDRYLNGTLQGDALKAFETRLTSDESLAQEVNFQRDLHNALKDSPENDLRKNLQKLTEEEPLPPNQNDDSTDTTQRWWLFLLLPIVLLAGWWLLTPMDTPKRNSPSFEQPILPSLPESILVAEINDSSLILDEPLTAPPPVELLAFEPNQLLENLLTNLEDEQEFEIVAPPTSNSFDIRALSDSAYLRLDSRFVILENLENKELRLSLFTNTVESVANTSPIDILSFDLQKTNTTEYQLMAQQKQLLPPGRYYWVLQDKTQSRPYFIQSFFVRLAE